MNLGEMTKTDSNVVALGEKPMSISLCLLGFNQSNSFHPFKMVWYHFVFSSRLHKIK